MGMLNFDKPKKIRTPKVHNEMHQSDAGVAGTYVPNMSPEDRELWKAKHIRGEDERIEIRKSLRGVQMLIVVYEDVRDTQWSVNPTEWHKNHQNVQISMNGKLQLSFSDWKEMKEAIREARGILLVSDIIDENL